jgi:hypothetical protein
MTQKEAIDLGYDILKYAPLSEEARRYIEASLPYLVQKYYIAGYEIVPGLGETLREEEK